MLQKPFSNCKPYIQHSLSLEGWKDSHLSNKRLYKYVHHLKFRREQFLNPKTARIKTLKSLEMDRGIPDYALYHCTIKIRRIQKFIKPRQKYLKTLKRELKHPQLLKLLPLLPKIHLNYDLQAWRLFATRSKFQSILLDLQHQRKLPKDPKRLLSLEKLSSFPLSRVISHQQDLQNLNITLNRGYYVQSLLKLLHQVDFSTLHLQHFEVNLLSAYKWPYQDTVQVTTEVKKALGYVKKLTLHDVRWFNLMFDGNALKNLSALSLKMAPQDLGDFKMLFTLKEIVTLKELDMIFQANSVQIEEQFLEYFILPENLETIRLTLVNFQWNEAELTKANGKIIQEKFDNNLFFPQWKNPKKLKVLHLTIQEASYTSKRCPGLAGNFASRILVHLSSLKEIKYIHSLGKLKPPRKRKKMRIPGKPSEKKKITLPVKPLNFEEFWKALEGSKNSLKVLMIDAPEIAFPVKMSSRENRFPRLKRILIGRKVLWARDLSCFWNGSKNKKQIEMQELVFTDEKKFEAFLDGIRKISKGVNFVCNANVESLKIESLRESLVKFLKEAYLMGKFELYLRKLKAEDNVNLEKLMTLLKNKIGLVNLEIIKLDSETLLLKISGAFSF